jgi:hypothetical protein
MMVQSQKKWLLPGNGCVTTFPQQLNHVTAAMNTHTIIEELLKAMFFVRPVPT